MSTEDYFGEQRPENMPEHFFLGASKFDYATAIRAEIDNQNYGMCPRHWYVDAWFDCARCQAAFCFSAREQKTWFEDYGFWVDAFPRHCQACRTQLRTLKRARQAYDATVAATLDGDDLSAKKALAGIIDQLYELGGDLPPRIHETRRRLELQLADGDPAHHG